MWAASPKQQRGFPSLRGPAPRPPSVCLPQHGPAWASGPTLHTLRPGQLPRPVQSPGPLGTQKPSIQTARARRHQAQGTPRGRSSGLLGSHLSWQSPRSRLAPLPWPRAAGQPRAVWLPPLGREPKPIKAAAAVAAADLASWCLLAPQVSPCPMVPPPGGTVEPGGSRAKPTFQASPRGSGSSASYRMGWG